MKRYPLDSFVRSFVCGVVLAVVIGIPARSRADDALTERLTKPGSTWGFLGDSITHMGSYYQTIQIYLSTRYPGRNIWAVNLGRSGDTATGAVSERLERDLSSERFDVVFVHFGMNDVGGFRFKEKGPPPSEMPDQKQRRDDYVRNLVLIVEAVRAAGAVPILLSPTIYDNNWENGRGDKGGNPHWNEELRHFMKLGQSVAEQHDALYIDLMTPMETLSADKQAIDGNFTLIGPDRIHPKFGGDEVMAYTILTALGFKSPVYEISLTAAGEKLSAENVEVENVQREGDTLTFDTIEHALPFPMMKRDERLALTAFDSELNRQMLKVTGLAVGDWELQIDGQLVGKYSSADLASGVNLATNEKTPQFAEAVALRALIQGKPATYFDGKTRSLMFREPGEGAEKEILEQLSRTLQPYFLKHTELRIENDVSAGQWATEVDGILAEAESDNSAREKRSGKELGGWPGFVARTSKTHLANLYRYRDRLREIRRKLAEAPSSTEHGYKLSPAKM